MADTAAQTLRATRWKHCENAPPWSPTAATSKPSAPIARPMQPPIRASCCRPPATRAIAHLVDEALASTPSRGVTRVERLMTLFGRELTDVVSRYVSTEVDARLSFDTDATIRKARALIADYDALGVSADRILIKIASTWAGIRAASVLEAEGIACNMTLIFSLAQAQACFEAGVTLISPFVGRITDWHKKAEGVDHYAPAEDPGVLSVQRINAYAKTHGYPTQVMAASFRNRDQILALSGADLMTISPALLEELAGLDASQTPGMSNETSNIARVSLDRAAFDWAMNTDAMATEKLAEGIRKFADDQAALEAQMAG